MGFWTPGRWTPGFPGRGCYHPHMAFPLRFHVLVLPNVAWVELKARFLRLEELGFEVAALPDHFVNWTRPADAWFESWSLLPALAEATSTIRISTAVTQIPLRNPAMLARQALTLDHISNGRIEIGLGTGITIDPSYGMTGIPNWDPRERADRFGEYIELVGLLLSQEVTTFAGRFYQAEGAVMNPRPVQSPRPPITAAALGPKMMRHAARFADTWNSMSFLETFEDQLAETRARCLAMDAIGSEIGRSPASLRRSYLMFDSQARHRGGSIGIYESRERFVESVTQIVALGISDIGLYYPGDPHQVPMFERIARDTLPILRSEYRAI